MRRAAANVLAARAVRDSARQAFDARVTALKNDLAERGIGSRIADDVIASASDGLSEAIEIVDSNRGVIAGTVAALALWCLRRPLTAFVLGWFARKDETDGEDNGGSQE